MERNILRTVALALMLMALCAVTSEGFSTLSTSEGTTISTTPTEGSTETLTPSEKTQSSTATSTPGNPQITSSAESSPTATPSEPTMKSHVTEVSTSSTEGSRKTSTSSEEMEKSTAISPSGTPPITSPTESSTSATTLEHTMKSHVTEISTEFTEGSRKTSTSTEETKRSTAISPPGTPPITESSATAITFEGTMISHVTEISTASTEGSRESSTSSGENENSTATSPPGSLVTKEETPTPSPPTTSTSPKPTTPKPPAVQTFTITYHIEETFTEELLDKSSAAYKDLEDKIGKMYQEVYNCSTCPNAGQYVGFMVNSFSKGSVVANTKVHFTESAKVSSEELRTALSDASEDKRQGLNLTQIEVTSDTTEPSTSPPSTTTSTTLPSLMYFLLSYHIEMVFSEDFLNPSSSGYEKLNGKIGKMYEEVYNCLGCPTAGRYYGYTVNSFRPGSVVADTTLWFVGGTSISSEELRNALSRASPEKRQYLNLANIEARNFGSDTPSHPETVPGWGIALLVLVCILLLLALIAFLIQIIHWCRRNHRGKLDLLSNQDSYHIMSEYPTYHTHGRYVAPGSKPNPYSETLPKNGNAPFSYTNPTMANDEL